MRFIISPAKTMVEESPLPARALPRFCQQARRVSDALCALDPAQRQRLWGCSDKLAAQAERFVGRYAQAFPCTPANLTALTPALFAYDGLQYQSLSAATLSETALEYLEDRLLIVSGMFGLLRPFDGIAPYRLEMQARLQVGQHANLYRFWGDSLFRALSAECDTVVNLASQEYARAALAGSDEEGDETGREKARVVSCAFYEGVRDGKPVQRAPFAKKARGSFVRWCAEGGIDDPAQLTSFDWGYRHAPDLSRPGTLAFLRCD
ncbi:YaaA family protein [Eggerthellaceae bacterium zg-1084]|uniref:YaaA family protein n=1 Tax=Berryella wangjianweii TaxID=2734634 RepID=UPI0015527045|nr:peroxide stress protein YaaA [Berryella wangjianweii]NPD31367.1 YaaA family protein [Berryella wangjianweii]